MANFYNFIICCLFVTFCYLTVDGRSCKFNKGVILERHNDLRLKHNAGPLQWSQKLEEIAKREANLLKVNSDCIISSKQINTNYFNFLRISDIERAVSSWYEGINDYDFELGAISKNDNIFEFTQLIWKSVEHVGCSTACCKTIGVLVCKYDSYANRPGYFFDNVGTIDTNYVFDDIKIGNEKKKLEVRT